MKRHKMRASYVQTLVYFDGPVLALLQNRKGLNILAFAVQEDIAGFKEPFIAKPTSEKTLSAYLHQKVDLNYLMRLAGGGDPYIFDWSKLDDEVLMVPAETVVQDVEELLPGPGFFARNHTEQFHRTKTSVLVRHAYRIDGRWSAKDFSRFYAKLDDLYSLFSFLEEMKSASELTKTLEEKIAKYPWQRGGSYLGFFQDIVAAAKEEYPLQVSRIQYASPGSIEVKGVESSLNQIDSLVGIFDMHRSSLAATNKDLRDILERDGVLGSDDKDFSVEALSNMALLKADELLAAMAIEDPSAIKEACQGHMVTYSKIALAIYRRGEQFHHFHLEGRMKLPKAASADVYGRELPRPLSALGVTSRPKGERLRRRESDL